MLSRIALVRTLAVVILASLVSLASSSGPVGAASFDVPGTHATLQAAVVAAAVSADLDNTISLSVSPFTTGAAISIGGAFGPARHLLIRPAAPLRRASVVSTAPGLPIFDIAAAGNVVLQDLDIVRNITNNYHLVVLSSCENVTIERCRIGSNWTTPGGAGWSNIELLYPTDVILRNNIFFAYYPGTFDRGIHAFSFNDPANSLWLYNNVVSDYRIYGIHVEAVIPGPVIVLRNNVAVNHTFFVAEPFAYRSNAAIGGPTIFTSHNVAFASAGFEESIPGGNQDLAGLGALFLQFPRPAAPFAFLDRDWNLAPPWDFNPGFYHLVPGGPLHNDPGDYGFTVPNAFPDVAVVDDIDRDPRPGGAGPHTDRGADQIDKSTADVGGDVSPSPPLLSARIRANPSASIIVEYQAADAGRLRLDLFDPAGRRLFGIERSIEAGPGSLAAPIAARGVVIYRLRLVTADGEAAVTSGKVVLLR